VSKQDRIKRRRERSKIRVGEGRETSLTRATEVREEKQSVLLATNGEKTESHYLKGLVASPERYHENFSKPAVKIFKGDPTALVRSVSRFALMNEFDLVFAVADTEAGEPVVKVGEAQSTADFHGIEMIWSRPSIEVWLIQHHVPCNAHLNDGDAAIEALRKHDAKYVKNEPFFDRYEPLVDTATRNGKSCTRGPKAADGNPSSAMWRLVEHLATGGRPNP
jgi:hypothetical protein